MTIFPMSAPLRFIIGYGGMFLIGYTSYLLNLPPTIGLPLSFLWLFAYAIGYSAWLEKQERPYRYHVIFNGEDDWTKLLINENGEYILDEFKACELAEKQYGDKWVFVYNSEHSITREKWLEIKDKK